MGIIKTWCVSGFLPPSDKTYCYIKKITKRALEDTILPWPAATFVNSVPWQVTTFVLLWYINWTGTVRSVEVLRGSLLYSACRHWVMEAQERPPISTRHSWNKSMFQRPSLTTLLIFWTDQIKCEPPGLVGCTTHLHPAAFGYLTLLL